MKEKKFHLSAASFVHSMQLPDDFAKGNILLTMHGQEQVIIENFKGLSCYTSEQIHLITRKRKICISGKCLKIDTYAKDEIEISGVIDRIEYF